MFSSPTYLLSAGVACVFAIAGLDMANAQAENRIIDRLGETGDTYALAFSPDGKWLAAGGSEQNDDRFVVSIWDVNVKQVVQRILVESRGSVKCLEFSHQGDTLLARGSLYSDHVVVFLKTNRKSIVFRQFENGGSFMRQSGFTRSGEIVGISDWAIASVWTIGNQQTRSFLLSNEHCNAAFLDRGNGFVVWSDNRSIYVLEKVFHDVSARIRIAFPNEFCRVLLDESSQTILGATDRGELTLIDVHGKRVRKQWQGHDATIYTTVRLQNGKGFATGDGKGFIKFWNWNGDLQQSLRPSKGVSTLALSPDGMSMASSGEDQKITLLRIGDIGGPSK